MSFGNKRMRRFELTSVGMTGGEAIDEVEAGGG